LAAYMSARFSSQGRDELRDVVHKAAIPQLEQAAERYLREVSTKRAMRDVDQRVTRDFARIHDAATRLRETIQTAHKLTQELTTPTRQAVTRLPAQCDRWQTGKGHQRTRLGTQEDEIDR
jgi:hypothetical protein